MFSFMAFSLFNHSSLISLNALFQSISLLPKTYLPSLFQAHSHIYQPAIPHIPQPVISQTACHAHLPAIHNALVAFSHC
jgi:hypothetical protein